MWARRSLYHLNVSCEHIAQMTSDIMQAHPTADPFAIALKVMSWLGFTPAAEGDIWHLVYGIALSSVHIERSIADQILDSTWATRLIDPSDSLLLSTALSELIRRLCRNRESAGMGVPECVLLAIESGEAAINSTGCKEAAVADSSSAKEIKDAEESVYLI